MKGLIARTFAAACIAGTLAATGCTWVGETYDRCWPQRYNHTARRSVVEGFAPQVQNGHVLDQTVWNYHFETGTDKLTPGGMAKLDTLVRRCPNPDPNVFLATARDVTYDIADPDKYAEIRRELDSRRVGTIQKYLQVQLVGRPMPFDVQIHDPYPVNEPGVIAARNARTYQSGTGGSGPAAGATGGAAGAATSTGASQSGAGGSGQSGAAASGTAATGVPRQ